CCMPASTTPQGLTGRFMCITAIPVLTVARLSARIRVLTSGAVIPRIGRDRTGYSGVQASCMHGPPARLPADRIVPRVRGLGPTDLIVPRLPAPEPTGPIVPAHCARQPIEGITPRRPAAGPTGPSELRPTARQPTASLTP